MDVPSNGLFINEPMSSEKLIYIRSLTYGVSAYFIIASEAQYKDILTAFKDSLMDNSQDPEGVLHKSQIILLTATNINQETNIKTTFNDLNNFLKDPFKHGETYGYPIYCLGLYTKNNEIFNAKNNITLTNPIMKSKLFTYSSFLIFGLAFLSSCSEDEDICSSTPKVNNQIISRNIQEKGRFDESPFQWDYFFSTDSSRITPNGVTIYPVQEQDITGRSVDNRRSSTGRTNTSRPSRPSSSTSNILVNNPNIVYVGAAFPESEFGNGFSKELLYPRNPIDISTSFPDSYIGEITKETGGLGYKNS